jgi:leader peptidase (prepilin peptidase) / N-methyltransferase
VEPLEYAYVAFVAVLGLAIGSFLNVVIWRVPRGESVVTPSSHCPNCDMQISPRDNIPVLSWLLLRGRCRGCGSSISARYLVVEVLTALTFGLLACDLGLAWQLPAYLYLAAVGIALAFIDLDTKRLPNALTLPSVPIMAVLLALPAIMQGRWDDYLRALLGGGALFAFYLLLAIVYPAGMGMGDVKLAPTLGIALAWFGWGPFVVGAFLAFLLGGVVGVALMVLRKAGRRSAIPFGPFMVAGAGIGILAGPELAAWYSGLLP